MSMLVILLDGVARFRRGRRSEVLFSTLRFLPLDEHAHVYYR
jgi:hypothetical protein